MEESGGLDSEDFKSSQEVMNLSFSMFYDSDDNELLEMKKKDLILSFGKINND